MQFKTDTKERFHVITVQEPELPADMTAKMEQCFLPWLEQDVKNLAVSLASVDRIDKEAGQTLLKLQQTFSRNKASFVLFGLKPAVLTSLEKLGLLEQLNVTPTESEAWDIVQMEEIERELLGEDPDS
jgi:anti-anti-sigma regulatory factor